GPELFFLLNREDAFSTRFEECLCGEVGDTLLVGHTGDVEGFTGDPQEVQAHTSPPSTRVAANSTVMMVLPELVILPFMKAALASISTKSTLMRSSSPGLAMFLNLALWIRVTRAVFSAPAPSPRRDMRRAPVWNT